jgi:protein O-GlcNAc transferase
MIRVWVLALLAGILALALGIGWRQSRRAGAPLDVSPDVARLVEEAGRHRAGGDVPGAQGALQEALRLQPDAPKALIAMGRLQFLDLSDPDSALATYRRAVAVAPTDPEAHYGLGQLLYFHGQHDAARSAFQEALRLRPGWSRAEAWLGTVELEAMPADVPAAIRHLEAAVAADARYAYARYQLGRVYGRAERWKEAVASLQEAVALKPGYREAYYALGQALLRLNRRQEARRALARFRELDIARRERRARNVRRRAGAGAGE